MSPTGPYPELLTLTGPGCARGLARPQADGAWTWWATTADGYYIRQGAASSRSEAVTDCLDAMAAWQGRQR